MNLVEAIGILIQLSNKRCPQEVTGFTVRKSGSLHYASIRLGPETINTPFGCIDEQTAIKELALEVKSQKLV